MYNYYMKNTFGSKVGKEVFRVAVCDDDLTYINSVLKPLISEALQKAECQAETHFFTDGIVLLNEFKNHDGYDVVILDIDMPNINGKDIAKYIREIDTNCCIAFLTAYSDEALNTIPYSIKAFIPKNYSVEKALLELVKLFKDYSSNNRHCIIFEIVKNGEYGFVRLYYEDIFYFQNESEHIFLHTKDEYFLLTEKSIKRLEARYDLTGFCRIHTDLIVNIGKVYEIMKTDIVLTNGIKLPVSRRRRSDLIAAFADLMTIKAGK